MCFQFDYREPWRSIVAVYAFGTFGVGAGWYQLLVGYRFAPPLARPTSGYALICFGLVLWGLAVRMTADRVRRRRSIKVADNAIVVPRSRWSMSSATVPLDEIRALRTTEALGLRVLHLTWPGGRIVVPSSMLPTAADFDRLLGLLAKRAPQSEIAREPPEARRGKRRFKLQFSMAGLFFLVTFVSVALGMYGYVYGQYSWDALFDIGIGLTIAIGGLWFASAAGRLARTFLLGFVVGCCMEITAVYCWFALEWVRFSAGSSAPENWYPVTFALWQLGDICPPAAWLLKETRAMLLAGLVSGLACGGAALAVASLTKRAGGRPGK